jgi:hypothetical protein
MFSCCLIACISIPRLFDCQRHLHSVAFCFTIRLFAVESLARYSLARPCSIRGTSTDSEIEISPEHVSNVRKAAIRKRPKHTGPKRAVNRQRAVGPFNKWRHSSTRWWDVGMVVRCVSSCLELRREKIFVDTPNSCIGLLRHHEHLVSIHLSLDKTQAATNSSAGGSSSHSASSRHTTSQLLDEALPKSPGSGPSKSSSSSSWAALLGR